MQQWGQERTGQRKLGAATYAGRRTGRGERAVNGCEGSGKRSRRKLLCIRQLRKMTLRACGIMDDRCTRVMPTAHADGDLRMRVSRPVQHSTSWLPNGASARA
eukprot:5943898-Pleurochrysis_carterae.AAC.3